MSWVYLEQPEYLQMPPCQRCGNRLRVQCVLPRVYHCGDCGHAFVAVWRAERDVRILPEKPDEQAS